MSYDKASRKQLCRWQNKKRRSLSWSQQRSDAVSVSHKNTSQVGADCHSCQPCLVFLFYCPPRSHIIYIQVPVRLVWRPLKEQILWYFFLSDSHTHPSTLPTWHRHCFQSPESLTAAIMRPDAAIKAVSTRSGRRCHVKGMTKNRTDGFWQSGMFFTLIQTGFCQEFGTLENHCESVCCVHHLGTLVWGV